MNNDENKIRVVQAENLAALHAAEHDWDVFAQLRSVKELLTKDNRPFLVLELADVHAVVEAKIWEARIFDDNAKTMAAARAAPLGSTLKLRGKVEDDQNARFLVVARLKIDVVPAETLAALHAADHDWDVFAQLREVRELKTKDNRPFLLLTLSDVHAVVEAKTWEARIFDDNRETMAAARVAPLGSTLNLRGKVEDDQNARFLVVSRLNVDAVTAENLAALKTADHDWDVFAQLREVRELKTKDNRPFLVLTLSDVHAVVEAKIWDDREAAMKAARTAPRPGPVSVRGRCREYKGREQFVIKQLEPIDLAKPPHDFTPEQLVHPALAPVEDLCCGTLVFDIETVPAFDRRDLPPTVAAALSDNATRKEMEPDAVMGMSPFFGKVVSLAIGDGEAKPGDDEVTVLAVPPEGMTIENCPKWLRPMSEPDLLRAFWALARRAKTVVSFNGRGFDIPFLITRSLIHGIPAEVDLMSQRFALRPHLDLFELVTQRGRGPSKLDVVCWALGIASPKEVMDGSMVAPAYARGEIVKIAEYNAHDVRATSAVYRKCRDLILRYRADW